MDAPTTKPGSLPVSGDETPADISSAQAVLPPGVPAGAAAGLAFGFMLPFRALGLLLRSPRVWPVAVMPLVMNLFFYAAAIGVAVFFLWNLSWDVPEWHFWKGFGLWMSEAINWAMPIIKWLIVAPLLLGVTFFSFTAVGMVVASPFNDMLSERIERLLCVEQDRPAVPMRTNLQLMGMSTLDSLRIVVMQGVGMCLVFPLIFVPMIGWIPMFLVVSYFSGLGFFDTAMARNNLRHRHKVPMLKQTRWAYWGMGMCMELLFLVPFVGLILLPVGVTAGALLYCRCDWEGRFADVGVQKPQGYVAPQLAAPPTS